MESIWLDQPLSTGKSTGQKKYRIYQCCGNPASGMCLSFSEKIIKFQVSMFYDLSWKSRSEVFSMVWTPVLSPERAELHQVAVESSSFS